MEKSIKKALSNYELLKMIKHKSNLLTYENLMHYENIDDILKDGSCIILYENRNKIGHWVCVFKNDIEIDISTNPPTVSKVKPYIEYFNSYGYKPDEEIALIDPYIRKKQGITYPHLTYLLWKSGLPISYNEHKLQKSLPGINTCGRWCAARLILKNIKLEQFVKLWRGTLPKDAQVTLFTKYLE